MRFRWFSADYGTEKIFEAADKNEFEAKALDALIDFRNSNQHDGTYAGSELQVWLETNRWYRPRMYGMQLLVPRRLMKDPSDNPPSDKEIIHTYASQWWWACSAAVASVNYLLNKQLEATTAV